MASPTPEFQVRFLTYLQRLLEEGEFTATYKFALLMALADLSVEMGDDEGSPLEIHSRDIARKFILYYSRQARPFLSESQDDFDGRFILHQNTGRQAAIINWIAEAESEYSWQNQGSAVSLLRDQSLVNRVAQNIRTMPLWKLQTLKRCDVDFLYPNHKKEPTITLRPGIASCFRIFHGFVYRLAQDGWIRFVRERKQNRRLLGDKVDLGAFLFGTERVDLKVMRPLLRDLQDATCFYCGKNLKAGEVDHFIAWSKYSIDLGHNFVLACSPCNNSKRDFLAAPRHLEHWLLRNQDHQETMTEYFNAKALPHDWQGSLRVARWAYASAARTGSDCWVGGKEFQPLGRGFCFPGT